MAEVLAEMVKNRDVKWDGDGNPVAEERASGTSSDCAWVHLEVDMSAIGMPTNSPLIAVSDARDDSLYWYLGATSIVATPRGATAREAAKALIMDVLLSAFLKFVRAESMLFPTSMTHVEGKGKGPVPIDRDDCTCSGCGGSLEITAADDCTMSVQCENGHEYLLEHDAFPAAFDYVLDYLSRRRVAE